MAAMSQSVARTEPPPLTWQHVHPYPSGKYLTSAAWGLPGYVVVGWEGEVLHSSDGLAWERIVLTSDMRSTFTGKVCYYDGKYVAIGNPGKLLWSDDGRNWNVANIETDEWLNASAGGGGHYLVAGNNQTLFVSANAQDWEARAVPADFTDMVYGNNMWVASAGHRIFVSTDLVSWASTFEGEWVPFWTSPILNTVSFGQGRFIAAGAMRGDEPPIRYGSVILTSTNGVVWDAVNPSDTFGEIFDSVFADGQFVAVHPDFFLRSINGETWEKVADFDGGGKLTAIAASPSGGFLAVGTMGAMLKSADAQNWQLISSNPREYLNEVVYADGRFVGVGGSPYFPFDGPLGSSAVVTSTNGVDWTGSLSNLVNQLSAVAYGNDRWVVCGDNGGIYTSTNAVDWVDQSLPQTSHDLHQLVYGKGNFVAFAYSRDLVYHSTNGVDWASADTPLASEVYGVRFLNGRFIGVGGDDGDGFMFVSSDGLDWEKIVIEGSGWLGGVAYGKGRYVAVGRDVSAVSLDGDNWMTQPIPFHGRGVVFASGWFIAVGPDHGTAISRDGVQWKTVESFDVNDALDNIAFGGGVVVANGGLSLYRSTVSDSEDFKKRLRLLSPAQLEFYGVDAREYRLEQSTNLMNWLPASEWTEGADHYLLWDANTSQAAENFWRAVERSR